MKLDTIENSSSNVEQAHRILKSLPREIQREFLQLREVAEQDIKDRDFQSIVEWLSPLNFSAAQLDIFDRHQAGTGRWLLESKAFKAWLGKGPSTLLCWGLRECH